MTFANAAARSALGCLGELTGLQLADHLPLTPDVDPAGEPGPREFRRIVDLQGAARRELGPIGYTIVRPDLPSEGLDTIVLLRGVDEVRAIEERSLRAERAAALGRLVAGLAHEVRNPLATLRALNEGLLLEVEPRQVRCEYAQRALEAVERIEGFVAAAVRFSRPFDPVRVRVELADLVAAARAAAQPAAAELTVATLPRPAVCCVDPAQVIAALAAVIDNALEAATSPAAVRVAAGRAPDDGRSSLFVEVRDDGPGVPAAVATRVFEPFYSTKPKRVGMGLALAASYADQNGGRLELASDETPGARFVLWLREVEA